MGINRIVTRSGVVWWLPPARPASQSAPPTRRRRPRREPEGTSPAGPPPAGFIPLSSLGIPGIDSILQGHADFYRDAYERALRETEGTADDPEAGDTDPGEERSGDEPGDAHGQAA